MKQFVLAIAIISSLVVYPSYSKAIEMPCNIVLEPIDKNLTNAKGVALVYEVQLRPLSSPRTNISIMGVHLPEPSSYGDYDSYEGFAFIPEVISWRFRLYPTLE
ncbi:MAG TPA: hypothetical protein VNR38_20275, partial [Ureibacillus sp.]|nr:hypothetical protein [Ureibacillus sp.]